MHPDHIHGNPADDVPQPLGTTMPCGCIVRAIFVSCAHCHAGTWGATPTDAEIGEQIPVAGTCTACGAPIAHLAVVCTQPAPAALGG